MYSKLLTNEDANNINLLKESLARSVAEKFDYVVSYGAYSGMRLLPFQFWGQGDLGTKILGLYEKEVVELFARIKKKHHYSILVDVGAADGYYAIGSLYSHDVNEVIAFENSERGRENLLKHAKLNKVDNKITLLNKATETTLEKILSERSADLSDMIFLVDIEGAEYTLFNTNIMSLLSKNHIIIEVHDCLIQDKYNTTDDITPNQFESAVEKRKLYELVTQTHDVEVIWQANRSGSQFEFLRSWPDYDRALLLSEGRTSMGCWWYLSPKS